MPRRHAMLSLGDVCILLSTVALTFSLQVDFGKEWQRFKTLYKKKYNGTKKEEENRGTFKNNLETILAHNLLTDLGVHSYRLGVNQFTDMNQQAFARIVGRVIVESNLTKEWDVMYATAGFTAPSSLDWRNSNLVTSVKNQGECGSCWAFSVVGVVEGAWSLKKKELLELSPQNLVDCTKKYGNNGCIAGSTNQAMKYVIDNGVNADDCYGYVGKECTCSFKSECTAVKISKIVSVARDEKALLEAVATYGPISVGINAANEDFKSYRSGVYNPSFCGQEVTHSLTLIGYGNQKGLDYWLLKNSWGTSWGENGYLKLARNKGGLCAITRNAIYAVV